MTAAARVLPNTSSSYNANSRSAFTAAVGSRYSEASMESKNAVKVLSALAQESRLAIYRLLVEHAPDGVPVGTIADRLGLANATLSFHLKELTHAGLLVPRQEGRFVYYAPSIDVMNSLLAFLTDNCCKDSGADCALGAPSCAPKQKRKPEQVAKRITATKQARPRRVAAR